MTSVEDKRNFLKKHLTEVAQATGQSTEQVELSLERDEVEPLLEQFRTKVYIFEKPESEYQSNAKKVILEASETLAYESAIPLINALKNEPRCQSIILLTDNVAQNRFKHQPDFNFVEIKDNQPLFQKIAGSNPDVAFTMVDASNAPNSPLLYGAKSVFGAKKLYFISTGWQGIGGVKAFDAVTVGKMDVVDGFFTNDELAKNILIGDLPFLKNDPRVYSFGTPYADTVERSKAAYLEREGRRKLGLDDKTLAVLYAGDKSFVWQERGFNSRINEISFERTLDAMVELAKKQPDRKFALLVRPHPGDINKAELMTLADSKEKPSNLKVVSAGREVVSMSEAGYAADVLVAIGGTEFYMQSLRGRKSVLLGFGKDGEGLGRDVLAHELSDDLKGLITEDPGKTIVSSERDLTDFLKSCAHVPGSTQLQSPASQKTATEQILDLALS